MLEAVLQDYALAVAMAVLDKMQAELDKRNLVIVPSLPTDRMSVSGYDWCKLYPDETYCAMLSAAPKVKLEDLL